MIEPSDGLLQDIAYSLLSLLADFEFIQFAIGGRDQTALVLDSKRKKI